MRRRILMTPFATKLPYDRLTSRAYVDYCWCYYCYVYYATLEQ
jgi:hypothetical protein